jgi:AraC-like DNA-binding protein
MATIAALQVEYMLAALAACGVRRSALCGGAGLAVDAFQDPNARLPLSVPRTLFAEAERLTGDRLVGLHAGELALPRGLLVYLLLSHPRLEAGLRQVERFASLASDAFRIGLTRQRGTVSVVIDLDEELAVSHVADYIMAVVANLLRRVIGVGDLLKEAHVRHGPWDDSTEAQRVFGCTVVKWGQPENRLVFAPSLLEAQSTFASPLVADAMVKFAESLRREAPIPATFRGRVEVVTCRMLARGIRPDRATVARELHVSDRTLRARLEEERTTFRSVRDEVVWELVTTLLASPNLTVETVAMSVGFGDIAPFSNAFKRWAGCAPTTYRTRLAAR